MDSQNTDNKGPAIAGEGQPLADGNSRGNDPTLLADDSPDTVLEPSDTVLDATRVTAQSATGTRPELTGGSVINDRFVLEKLLGRGGMGLVYRALDRRAREARDRNPYVAIKILSQEFRQQPQAFVALQREARKSQTLAHPNIITVYDFDRDGDVVYMTMEELNGVPLDQFIREHPDGIPPSEALGIINGLAAALAYAHSKNIVHSDLKPGNVFLLEDGTVKVLDFGIARAVADATGSAGDKTLFDPGELGGLTPAYASYEMLLGEAPHPADDMYALGLICYELLTGSHPFQRMAAHQALGNKMTPARIPGLKHYQWRAIADALQFQREARSASGTVFQKSFRGMASSTRWLAGALGVTVMVALIMSVIVLQPERPEVAFDSLPAEVQDKVSVALEDGWRALDFDDYNGALYHFDQAFQLHPGNRDALEGMDLIVTTVLARPFASNDAAALQVRREQINTLLAYSALAGHKDLLAAKKALPGGAGG